MSKVVQLRAYVAYRPDIGEWIIIGRSGMKDPDVAALTKRTKKWKHRPGEIELHVSLEIDVPTTAAAEPNTVIGAG